MTTNLFLDTNVIIDYLGKRSPFYASARMIVAAGFFGDARLWMSAQSAKDAYYVLCHYASSDVIQDALLALYEVVTPVDLTGANLERGARLKWDDYEDCLIALTAEDCRADFLITRDEKGFGRSMTPALTPSEWLSRHEAKTGITYDDIEL